MKSISISKVATLEDRRLAVYPSETDEFFPFIYREAAGVSWDQELECFKSTPPKDMDYKRWFTQIVGVVGTGLKVRLNLTDNTVFDGADASFPGDIKEANQHAQEWIDKHA